MAGGQERILRGRIKTVQSTKKITKAMELIAASRILKAQGRVAAARPYSEQITEVIRNLASGGAGLDHPLLQKRADADVKSVAYVAIAGDRGLAGGYSSGVIRHTERAMAADRAAGRTTQLYAVGKKAIGYFSFRGIPTEATFLGLIDQPTYDQARDVAAAVSAAYDSGAVDKVELVYNQFLSAGSQRLVQRTLMPLDTGAVTEGPSSADGPASSYEFEPSPDVILAELLPRYAEARLFAALLDASASFFAFQQRAMKAASDNADELIKTLSRIMNRARQDSITTEIMEIVGGAEALRQSQSSGDDLLIDQVWNPDLFPAITTER